MKLHNLMRPKFQKRSALKFDGRIIPEAKRLCRNVFADEVRGNLKSSFALLGARLRSLLSRKKTLRHGLLWRGCSFVDWFYVVD